MKVKDIISKYGEGKAVEVYAYTDRSHRIHSDYIVNIDGEYSEDIYLDKEAADYEIMEEGRYNDTILANTSMHFSDMFDADDKVLVIVLPEDWEAVISAHDRYDKENTKRVSLKFNKKTDSEILEWLDRQENKQGAIKDAIMCKIREEKYNRENCKNGRNKDNRR